MTNLTEKEISRRIIMDKLTTLSLSLMGENSLLDRITTKEKIEDLKLDLIRLETDKPKMTKKEYIQLQIKKLEERVEMGSKRIGLRLLLKSYKISLKNMEEADGN